MKCIAALLLTATAWAQTPVGTFRIAGSLIDAVTGEPVRRAAISLQVLRGGQGGQASQTAMSDAGGRFEFAGLSGGTYLMSAERRGYPKQTFGSPAGFNVSADMPDISFQMQPYSVLTGTVLDENGDPIAGAAIQLIRSQIQAGRRELQPAVSTVTDDRGEYRVASLVGGRYYVSAYARAQDAGDSAMYARRFYPASRDLLSAVPLELEAGSNQRADFRLEPEPAFHIRGQISGYEGLTGISVVLGPRTPAEAFGGLSYPVRFTGEGHFEISGVTPGQYAITAAGHKDAAIQSASQALAIGAADLEGVTLTPGPGAGITGHVMVEQKDGTAALLLGQIGITLQPDDSITKPILAVQLAADLSFSIPQALGGDYTLRVIVPEPYYLKSASSGGLDVLAGALTVPLSGALAPLELVIGSNGGEVSGTVSVQDKPADNCAVLLIRNGSRSASQNKFAMTDANGKFIIRAIAPGEYTAYSWRDVSTVEYRNPQALGQYSGVAVTVTEGAKQSVELKLNGN